MSNERDKAWAIHEKEQLGDWSDVTHQDSFNAAWSAAEAHFKTQIAEYEDDDFNVGWNIQRVLHDVLFGDDSEPKAKAVNICFDGWNRAKWVEHKNAKLETRLAEAEAILVRSSYIRDAGTESYKLYAAYQAKHKPQTGGESDGGS